MIMAKNHHEKNLDALLSSPLILEASKEDRAIIMEIIKRTLARWGAAVEPLALAMDLTACHMNGCPLQLSALLVASDLDFNHDVFGIRKHLNRETGKLMDCFLPRFADLEARDVVSS